MALYEVVRDIQWRELPDGTVEVDDLRGGPAVRFREGIRGLLADVTARADVAKLATHFPGGERRARQFLLHLRRLGYVEIPLDAPRVFGGRYEVARELGRGGAGVAWLCMDGAQEVVVKAAWDFLVPLAVADAAVRAEDAVLRELRHPSIVARLDSFEERGRLHLVREYVEGADLGAYERAPIDAARARSILREAAAIVAAAHDAGFLLLDLRPGNFVQADRLVLLDVGLARKGSEVALDAAVGVAGFVAPEVLREKRATRASDVWALGALYAFLRTGRHDAKGDVLTLAAKLPEEERALVAKLCAADAAARPTAREIVTL